MKTNIIRNRLPRTKITVVFFASILILGPYFTVSNAFGDGLTQENLPPASVGNRQASLFIKISPPILTKENVGDTFIELRLFDANDGKTIEHTSFFVTVDKGGELLMRDLFHTHSGDLTIKVQPTPGSINDVVVYGDKEPFQGGWTATNDQISVKAPILLEAGLYHFAIEIFGIDNDRNIFIPSDAPKFDSWLSVGDIFNQKVVSTGKSYDVSVTSYYDVLNNFQFDESTKTISFSMPFNWDIQRLESQNIFVHEEVHFPVSFTEFSKSPMYKASVNGFPVTGRMLISDPYSLENTLILHFLINKENILDIAKTIKPGEKSMQFSLSPASGISVEKNSFDVKFDTGAFARVEYEKKPNSENKIPFYMTFFDKNGKLLKFLRFGYSITDPTGKKIIEAFGNDTFNPGILLTEGIDKSEFSLPSSGEYKMTLAIFSHGQDNQQTYTGIASNTFEIGTGSETSSSVTIPTWIKNNAGWWAEGTISDSDFIQGIQFLIKNQIMKIPTTQVGSGTSQVIPAWIKNNAGWWAEGTISDSDFIQGIQWLITNGIMKV
jgi:hypothetical protein